MSLELIQFKPNQHAVTFLPRFTTELPFFYFTKQKAALQTPIEFEGTDPEGKPIRWRVSPNTNKRIGAPGIDAHEVWVKLIKPAIDEQRTKSGELTAIVPLGSVRKCLVRMGWKSGGWEAQHLFRCIKQIALAGCEADFWLPTAHLDQEQQPLFRRINSTFTRLNLHAIGATHISESELRSGHTNFDFALEDTVYIELDAMEIAIQNHEGQRPVDNEYLFSVSPAERRWYELLAPKIYGVTQNNGRYCKILYSWYVERHHTLTRQTERRRVVQQMNNLIQDHLHFGFVLRVDYQVVKEQGKPDDYLIRYYPGRFAQITTARILTRLRQKPREPNSPTQVLLPMEFPAKTQGAGESIVAPRQIVAPEADPLIAKLTAFGITDKKATALVQKHPEEVKKELEALPARNLTEVKDVAAWLIRAIERGNYSQPVKIVEQKTKEEKRKTEEVTKALTEARQRHEKRFEAQYSDYVQEQMADIKKSHPEAYRTYERERADVRQKTERAFRSVPTLMRKALEADFMDFFFNHPVCPVLNFWQWDTQRNPTPFQEQ
jgi:hypothetical protein